MKVTRFEDIEAWKVARGLNDLLAQMSFDPDLSSQLTRASNSAMANIAEGFASGTDPEFCRFLRIARRSLVEVQSHLYAALDRRQIERPVFDRLYALASDGRGLIGGFIRYLTRK